MDSGGSEDASLQLAKLSVAGKTSNSPNAASRDGCISVEDTDKDNAGRQQQRTKRRTRTRTPDVNDDGQQGRMRTRTNDNNEGGQQGMKRTQQSKRVTDEDNATTATDNKEDEDKDAGR